MNKDDFVTLVAAMRQAQRDYFADPNRTRETLDKAKDLERQVDRAIHELTEDPKQGKLFV